MCGPVVVQRCATVGAARHPRCRQRDSGPRYSRCRPLAPSSCMNPHWSKPHAAASSNRRTAARWPSSMPTAAPCAPIGDIDAAGLRRARRSRCCRRCRWWPAARPTRFKLSDEELALACASHNGEARHVATAAGMLAKAGLDAAALECGAHWPQHEVAQRELRARSGTPPSALHNNCSGKHAGFLCLGCLMARAAAATRASSCAATCEPEHPVMREVTAALQAATGCDLSRAPRRHRRLLDPDLRHPAAPAGAGVRQGGHRRRA